MRATPRWANCLKQNNKKKEEDHSQREAYLNATRHNPTSWCRWSGLRLRQRCASSSWGVYHDVEPRLFELRCQELAKTPILLSNNFIITARECFVCRALCCRCDGLRNRLCGFELRSRLKSLYRDRFNYKSTSLAYSLRILQYTNCNIWFNHTNSLRTTTLIQCNRPKRKFA